MNNIAHGGFQWYNIFMNNSKEIKNLAIQNRKNGLSYSEIMKVLPRRVSKSVLSYWLKDIPLNSDQKSSLLTRSTARLFVARQKGWAKKKELREAYLDEIRKKVAALPLLLEQKDIAQVALALLFISEGSKQSGHLVFGNSDPYIIRLFLKLLRQCYEVNEAKFRCTLQCRADQDTTSLEKFWSEQTGIPPSQFYKSRIDARTIGKPSRKPHYKGVCRIDYFSAHVYNELTLINVLINDTL